MDFWGMMLCAFLATFLATVLGGLNWAGAFRKRRSKEPPLDKGFIPWLGYGIHFRKNTAEFLKKMQKKHGDIFTLLIAGTYMHYVLDPHAHEAITKESKGKLDYTNIASTIVSNVFGFQPTELHHNIVVKTSHKTLRGKNLGVLNDVMMEKLQLILLPNQGFSNGERAWHQDGLYRFSYKTIFQASFLALFGNDIGKENAETKQIPQCEEMFEAFLKFDDYFPQMASGILGPLRKKETEKLKHFFWDLLSVEKLYQKDGISSWVVDQDQKMADIGMNEKMRSQFFFLLFWASQANTGPASFWHLLHLLKHPEAKNAVKEEVDRILRETGQEAKPGGPFINISLETVKTPLLDSAIEESLRLKTATSMFRSVLEDLDLKMGDGREYRLRKGDILVLFPFIAMHVNPEMHTDPHSFKYDRFLNPDGTKKEFYKNGEKLKHSSMPFGGGPSICPGRFFAVSEMKLFIILMLTYFDMELVNEGEEIPSIDMNRYGFGVMHPIQDIQFRYRLRF